MREVYVSADRSTGMVAHIKMEDQEVVIDESGLSEGKKFGPDPDDYIMSALGACTVITLHMYAKRKEWPLERVEVKLQHGPFESQAGVAEGDQKTKRMLITKKLKLIGDLSQEQIERLKTISSRCPVQRTLEAGVMIQTDLE